MGRAPEGWATLYCDASGLGGYGIIGISDAGKLERGGKAPTCNSTACELYAILAGCKAVTSAWDDIKGILVNSDSQEALRLAKNALRGVYSKKSEVRVIQKQFPSVLGEVEMKGRWIKGHCRGRRSSAYMNRKVDMLAAANNN